MKEDEDIPVERNDDPSMWETTDELIEQRESFSEVTETLWSQNFGKYKEWREGRRVYIEEMALNMKGYFVLSDKLLSECRVSNIIK